MIPRIKLLIVISLVFIFFSVSAIENQNPQWKGTVEEEDGVKVIKNPNEPLYGEITFDLEEDLSIGNEEDENYMFYRAGMLAVDSEGNILVLDAGNYRIQKYDKDGKYLLSIGRRGQGPGEFEEDSSRKLIYLDSNDNIYVLEKRRIHRFKNNGELLGTIKLKQVGSRWMREFRLTREENIIVNTTSRAEMKSGMPPNHILSNIDLFNSEGDLVETIATYHWKIDYLKVRESWRMSPTNYHEPRLFFSQLDEELSVYGYSSEYKLLVINSLGDIIYKFEKGEKPQSLTNDDKDKVLDDFMEKIERQKTNYGFRKFSIGEVKKAMNFPKYMPFFGDIICDDKNRIYVKEFKSKFSEDKNDYYNLFSKDGYYLYHVTIPLSFLLIRNGFLYRVERDEETSYSKIKRYRIKNWNQIKTGIN